MMLNLLEDVPKADSCRVDVSQEQRLPISSSPSKIQAAGGQLLA